MSVTQGTLENWEQKAHRLALELKEIRETPLVGPGSSERARKYRSKKYELDMHIARVTDDG